MRPDFDSTWWTIRATLATPPHERESIVIDGFKFEDGKSKIYVPELITLDYGYNGVSVELQLGRTHKYNWSVVVDSPVKIKWRRWERDGHWTREHLLTQRPDTFTAPYDQVYPPSWIIALIDDVAPQRWLLHIRRRAQEGDL